MDQDTPQNTKSLLLELLLEDANDKLDKFEAQLLLKDTNQPASRLEEVDPDRGVALHIWKSEIERQQVILSDFCLATALSLGREAEETPLPKETKTFAKFISATSQKLIHSLKNIMRSIKDLVFPDSQPDVCTSCGEICSEIFKTQCSHFYCKNCLIRMVTKSLQDESLFPPQCCHKPIEGSDMKKMIGSALAQEQKKRATELGDPDRTYCSDLRCSEYISPTMKIWPNFNFKTAGTCRCGIRTCRKCKRSAHGGNCLSRLDKPLEKLMMRMRWQRCNKCGRVIELKEGCPHIT
ncbi:Zinc finger, RING/FYVE/PHD-type [Penicillium italicum]|uniref:RBR-type E3 ubiquitin transferase n=1 Tax=Penicillium italicum TaxID=40296 RepID=A0A0A2L479_PENIT|nr:Zinc finger, RING/FYVE/PHD-type [Penicillium italicum]